MSCPDYMPTSKIIAILFLALPLAAQQFTIDAGSTTDRNFTGGYVYANTFLAATGIHKDMRAGATFAYDVPVVSGSCSATLDLIENRATGPNPATDSAIGTRVFTVTSPTTSTTIDIFALAGAQRPFQLALPPIPVSDGHLRLRFTAAKGNAVLSGLEVNCVAPPTLPITVASDGTVVITGNLYVTGGIFSGINASNAVWRCNGPTSPTSDCTGMYFVQVAMQDGTLLKIVGVSPDPDFAITPQWIPVPLPSPPPAQ